MSLKCKNTYSFSAQINGITRYFSLFGGGGSEESTISIKEREQQEAMIKALPKDLQKVFRYSALFDNLKRGETMAVMSFDLEIK